MRHGCDPFMASRRWLVGPYRPLLFQTWCWAGGPSKSSQGDDDVTGMDDVIGLVDVEADDDGRRCCVDDFSRTDDRHFRGDVRELDREASPI